MYFNEEKFTICVCNSNRGDNEETGKQLYGVIFKPLQNITPPCNTTIIMAVVKVV